MGACLDKLLSCFDESDEEFYQEKEMNHCNEQPEVVYEFEKNNAMSNIEGFDENYALASLIHIFLEIDEFRRFFILEKLDG